MGGEIGYVTVDSHHRRKGLGRAVVALAVDRLITAGYRHIFVGVQGWRLPAVRCYLRLGFLPLLHNEELLPRWQRICNQIGWSTEEAEWPRSLAFAAETGAYVLSGRARIYFGQDLGEYLDLETGDFMFVPPFLPHLEANMSTTEQLWWLACRTPDNIVVNLPDVDDASLAGYRRPPT